MNVFTEAEIEYLKGQRLGRLATIGPDGNPQNNPVAFSYSADTGTIDIGGYNMGASRKFRNVRADVRVSFVVDDIASIKPWRVRGVEIRGRAEALAGQTLPMKGASNGIIRIHPRRIISWGIAPAAGGMQKRNVEPDAKSVS